MTDLDGRPVMMRVTRCTRDLVPLADFYSDTLGLQPTARFRDHDGFDGDIFDIAPMLQWELTAGPVSTAPALGRSAWTLAQAAAGLRNAHQKLTDPDGYAVRTTAAAPSGSRDWLCLRPTTDISSTLSFYRDAYRLVVIAATGQVVDLGLEPHRRLLRVQRRGAVVRPDIEDLLVLTYRGADSRADAARRALGLGGVLVTPHNPWWRTRALCVQESDGFTTALTVAGDP